MANDSLFTHNDHLEKAEKLANIGHWELNFKTNHVIMSHELKRILGCNETDIGLSLNDYYKFIHSDDMPYVKSEYEHSLKHKVPFKIEYRFVRPDGRIIILFEEGNVTLDDSGEVIAIGGIVQDITLQRSAEKALWKTEYKLAVAMRVAGLVSWEYDPSDGRIDWSEGVQELLGFEPRTIKHFAIHVHPQDLERVIQAGIAAEKGSPYNIEYRLIRPDGKIIQVYEQAEYLYDRHGNLERIIGTTQDITERTKTKEHLLNSDKLSVVGQLAAGVAHEIRNPLTSLRGFIQLMQAGKINKEYLSIMLNELDSIEFIVKEFLNLAKPQPVTFEYHNIIKELKEVILLLSTETNLYNIQIDTVINEEIPNLYCSNIQIKQVFLNLLKNAIESMSNGGKIRIFVESLPSGYVVIKIKDEGQGIPKERLEKIGEPFYSTKEKGTGIGIMVCHKIIDSHQGEISFQSEEGKGTTVTITLPIT